mgnify:CR=1 FL=1
MILLYVLFFFFKQKTAYEMLRSLVGSEMCIRDSASSGASEHLLIAQYNLAQAIERMKQLDIWIYGLDQAPSSKTPAELRFDLGLALVVGNEGTGMRQLVRQSCDELLRLPMVGKIESLNAAVAGSIALYLVRQARLQRA